MTVFTYVGRTCAVAAIICALVAPFAGSPTLAAESKRVLMLHSFGRDFKPWKEYGLTIRTELDRQSPWPLDIQDQSLVSARDSYEAPEVPFIEYLRALYSKNPPDLIVALGAPAAIFVQRYRPRIFPKAPMVFTAVEQRRIDVSALTELDTVVAVGHDFPAIIENILQILPDTKNVTVVIGNSPNEKFWLGEMQRELKPFEDRVAFTWTSDQSFNEILKRASNLPPHSAIYWHGMLVDAAGAVHEGDSTLKRLHAIANAPMFSFIDVFFNGEIVGGPMHSMLEGARETGAVAMRILNGERPGDIRVPPTKFAAPIFDWRELRRWSISESRLPRGSEIRFREPTAWERYRTEVLAIFAVLLLQAALIGWLMYEHRRRHLAELTARNSIAELTHMNRVATAGELSASIAHEVNQPLTGMVTRANAALRWLAAETPDLAKARDALTHIVSAGHRASDIITNVKSMFSKDTTEKSQIDVNQLVWTVLELVRVDLQKHQIDLEPRFDHRIPPVFGNQIQLQQVILNLIMNAVDSMRSVQRRVLSITCELNGPDRVQVSIEDTGVGISPADLGQIFKPMFTTKDHGMGMGLSICHSIIENHNGRIWVTAGSKGGTIFHFELPTKAA